MTKIFAISLLSLFLLSGCVTRLTDFTAISTKNLNIDVKKEGRVEGKDCANLLLGLIPVTGTFVPNLKEAIDDALEKGKGDVLIDGVVYHKVIFIPLVFTQSCYKVEGTIGNSK